VTKYAKHIAPDLQKQTEKADERQIANSGGGFGFKIDNWKRLERFLIIGNEGGTYYATEKKLTIENAACIKTCLTENGPRTIEVIASISEAGRAPKNDAAIFALAIAASCGQPVTQNLALDALPRVCRIGTHLFQFVEAVDSMRGWGRGLRNAIGKWYESKTPEQCAYQALKYQQRGGWSHRDVLRLAHVKARKVLSDEQILTQKGTFGCETDVSKTNAAVYRWIVTGKTDMGPRDVIRGKATAGELHSDATTAPVTSYEAVGDLPALLVAYESLKTEKNLKKVLKAIADFKLTHEMIPGEWKSQPAVWGALADHMPLGALIRNLAKLTAVGVIGPMNKTTKKIKDRLSDHAELKKAKIHPIAMLAALQIYRQGHGEKGKLIWDAVPAIIQALNEGFYAAFDNIEPTGKNTLIALDVSASMQGNPVLGLSGIDARMASAAMAMVTVRSEPNHHVMAFSGGLIPLKITPSMSLEEVMRAVSDLPFQNTDCALPMSWAQKNKIEVDSFQIWTDSETNCRSIHPYLALQKYRNAMNKPMAKLAVCATSATDISIADPNDLGSLDLCGFDANTPILLADFFRG
jgi:60 kDa SS-A/Ro ribonucleoprotein